VDADTSPTSRALTALELLQAQPGITAEKLAEQLGVTERAARRYIGILREAGIPVESIRGRYGGYRLGRGLRLPPLTFSASEALGLVMAVLDGHHDAADGQDPVGSALGKIMRGLPAAVAAQAQTVRRHVAPAPDRAAARPDQQIATALVQGCVEHRTVRIDYRSEAGSEWQTVVQPWAVVIRHARWYLLCLDGTQVRSYRVDRVRTVQVLDESFDPPADLDAVATLEENLSSGWEYPVEVVVDAPAELVSRVLSAAVGRVEPIDGARSRVVGSTGNPYWCAEQLARLPVAFSIVESEPLRVAAREVGRRLLDAADG
jgi:predicted DNA-binding transcriptional regulator YafY